MSDLIRVLAVDDQRVVREGLVLLLGLLPDVEVVGTAADGDEAVAQVGELHPDVVLMDLRMPHCDGVEATRQLSETHSDVKVIVLTTYADDQSVIAALRAGARGYLTKDAGATEIQHALQQVVVADRAVIDPAVQHHLVDTIVRKKPAGHTTQATAPGGLTPRELEVLTHIAEGRPNTDIATRLVISEATVKSHINHLLAKIGARDRAGAVSYAYQHGLLPRRGDADG